MFATFNDCLHSPKISIIILSIILSVFFFTCQKKAKDIAWIERIDPELSTVLSDSVKIDIIAEGFDWSEGPLWLEEKQTRHLLKSCLRF